MHLPLSRKGGTRQPRRELYNAATLASGDEFPMNAGLTSENSVKAKFREFTFHALG
jgi:hypothetical protein